MDSNPTNDRSTNQTACGRDGSGGSARRLGVALSKDLRDFRRRLKVCRHRPDAEAIHQLRVQTRRMVVWCDLLGGLDADHHQIREARRRLKKLLRSLARLRDLQVQVILLTSVPKRLEPAARRLKRDLRNEEPHWDQRVKERLRRIRPSRLSSLMLGGETAATVVSAAIQAADPNGEAVVVGRWLMELQDAAETRLHDARGGSPGALHRFRIAVKHLRYGLEAVSGSFVGISATTLRRLRNLQGKLGAIQDFEVCRVRLETLTGRHPGWTDELDPLRRWLLQQRDGRIRRLIGNDPALLTPPVRLRVVRPAASGTSSARESPPAPPFQRRGRPAARTGR